MINSWDCLMLLLWLVISCCVCFMSFYFLFVNFFKTSYLRGTWSVRASLRDILIHREPEGRSGNICPLEAIHPLKSLLPGDHTSLWDKCPLFYLKGFWPPYIAALHAVAWGARLHKTEETRIYFIIYSSLYGVLI